MEKTGKNIAATVYKLLSVVSFLHLASHLNLQQVTEIGSILSIFTDNDLKE